MIKFIKDIFKDLIVSLLSTAILSVLTIYGVKYFEEIYEVNINPKYVTGAILTIIIIAFINLYRVSRKKRIDRIQEPSPMFFSMKNPDGVLTTKNNLELYNIDIEIKNQYSHNQFENNEPSYSVIHVNGPFCPACEIPLKEKRTLFGSYKHFCPRGHVKFKNKFNSHSMTEHKKVDINKELRENGLKKLSN